MPKRKAYIGEEDDSRDDEPDNENSDYADSDNEKPLVASRSSRTRKKSKPIKAKEEANVDEPSGTIGTKNNNNSKNASQLGPGVAVKSTPDGEKYIELGKKKRVTVRIFKGTPLIDIREFYTDASGIDKPGKKGLSLGLDQWETLKTGSKTIDELLVTLQNK
ncbi:transcriptional Coactivator p15-domain-containing protein [Collybia nuda]|uniref:Transcriptional Coactivator p15-domain-containing protein n=1 Tax=Collybia nuda TaxID=64659 RepID=A0A9P5Y1S2_9AGAR|nr:transcriptional Coactivator p15-domain-containing protein [Collybia nuda]